MRPKQCTVFSRSSGSEDCISHNALSSAGDAQGMRVALEAHLKLTQKLKTLNSLSN